MKTIRIHTPKPQTQNLPTLPAHEQAARRARALTQRPTASPNPRRAARPVPRTTPPADFRTNPKLFGE